MTSAYASPPPFRFGPADLKAHARKFLERALVISALVHLSAAGLFRAAQERIAFRAEQETPIPKWKRPTWVTPPIEVTSPPHFGGSTAKGGVYEPRPQDPWIQTVNPGVGPDIAPVMGSPGEKTDGGPPNNPPPSRENVRAFGIVDTAPAPLHAPKPPYPEWARETGIEGKVILRVLVGIDGIPKQVQVLSGPKGLVEEARNAVLRWTFRPGMSGRDSVEVPVIVPITFRLSGN